MSVLQAVRAFSDAMDRMHGGMKGDMDMNATDLAALRMLIVREGRGETVSPHEVARAPAHLDGVDDEAAGPAVRVRDTSSDARIRAIAARASSILTDESRSSFFRHFGERLRAMRGVADRYTDDELAVITRFLARAGRDARPAVGGARSGESPRKAWPSPRRCACGPRRLIRFTATAHR